MFFDILTLFPKMFDGVFSESIIKRAVESGLVDIHLQDIREYATDRHRTVDDYPYGGDAGMLMMPGPLSEAINAARKRHERSSPCPVVFMTPQGKTLNQDLSKELADLPGCIVLCGRYKGIDQRIRDKYVDIEISIGDYVLSGGEIPAMVLIDSIVRLLPGALGNRDSAEKDSFYDGLLSPPQYTRPEVFEEMRVPEVLLSGHHERILQWKHEQALKITGERRPDLMKKKESE